MISSCTLTTIENSKTPGQKQVGPKEKEDEDHRISIGGVPPREVRGV